MLSQTKLHHKRQRKEAKRNIKRKAVRKYLNDLAGLGVQKRSLALHHARRTAGINEALAGINAIIKRWSDKISETLLAKIDTQKLVLKTAMKSKDDKAVQQAVNDFVPLNAELIEIVRVNEKGVENSVMSMETNKDIVIP